MALVFDAVYNSEGVMRGVRESQRAFAELRSSAENEGRKIDAAFNKQIYEGSQSVNALTGKIIDQKKTVRSLTKDIDTLTESYKKVSPDSVKGKDLFASLTNAKSMLKNKKEELLELQTQQAQVRLSVRKLRDEYSLYQKEGQNVVESNNNMALSFKKTLATIGGVAAIKQFVSEVLKVRGQFQQLDVAFTTLLQSKEKANALMAQMVETAAKTPFNLTELATGAKQLVAYGFASEGVNDTLIRLGNIASGLGLPLERLTYLYGTTMTQGRLYARDLMQFTTSGIPMLQGLADMYGVSTDKVNEMVTAGKIGFPEVQKVIENMTNEGGKFFNLMEEQSKTITGKISNLGDAWDEMLNKIGQSQEGVINNSIDGLKYLVENYEKIGQEIFGLVTAYGAYKAAIIVLSVVERARYTATLAMGAAEKTLTAWQAIRFAATEKLTVAQKALNAAMLKNPYVLIGVAVAGLTYGIYKLATAETVAEKAARQHREEQEKFKKTIDERKQRIEELIRIIQDETETEYAKAKAYDELQKLSPALTSAYTREQLAVASLTDTNKKLNEERDKNNYDNIISNVNKYAETLSKARKEAERLREDAKNEKDSEKAANLSNLAFGQDMAAANAERNLSQWQKDLDEYNRLKKEAEESAKPVEVKLLEAKSSRDQIVQEYAAAKLTFEEEQRKIQESGFGVIPIDVQIRFDNAKAQLASIDKTIASLMQGNTTQTYKEAYNTAQREWKAAQKALEESKKKSKADYDKAKKDLDEKEKAYKDLGGITGSSLTKQESAAENLRKQQEKLKSLQGKQSKDSIRQAKDLEFEAVQAKISAMQEGSEKSIAQMNLDHQKEIETLKRNRQDYLQKKIEAERAIFEADPSNKGKSFDSSTVSLSKDEESMFNNLLESTISQQGNELATYYKEILAKYQGYAEKRLAAQKKFQQERDALVKAGASKEAIAENDYQREETFKSIDNEFAMREDSFKAWADNIADLSLEKLRVLLVQAERELERSEFLNPKDPKLAGQRAKVTSLKNTISAKTAETNTSPNKRSQKEWQDLYKTLSEVENEFEEIGKAVGGTAGEILSAAGSITASTLKMIDGIKTLSDSSIWAISSTATAAEKAIQAVEKASVILAIIGAAMKVASEITQMIAGESQEERMKKTVEYYNKIIDIYDQIINKQKESIKFGFGFASIEAATKAMDELNKKTEYNRKIAEVSGKSGISLKDYAKEYERLAKEFGLSLTPMFIGSKAGIDTSELSRLTGQQLEYIRDNYKELWAGLRDEQRDALQAIIDAEKEGKEVIDAWQEAITGISYDSFYTEFIDTLSDMDSSAEDMAENFGEYLKKSILAAMVAKEFKGKIDELYQMWVDAGGKDSDKGTEISEDEARKIQEKQKELTEAMIKRREEMEKVYGWENSESTSQNSTQKGFEAMSQDTGTELNGRFTALQVSNEEIKNSMLSMLSGVNLISTSTAANGITLTEIRNLAISSNSYLEDIAGFQKRIVNEFGVKLDNINSGIKQFNGKH